ncbi:MAG: hypothetical protein M9921_10085 [Fimbriimonadaceae bacterium]|nr:hypothetical protein [Fimbriimonadaceae bacterium]
MRISLSGRQFAFPPSCACCGGFPLTYVTVSGAEKNKLARTAGWTWDIPHCKACKRHIKAADRLYLFGIIMLALSVAGGAFGFITSQRPSFGWEVTLSLIASSAAVFWLLDLVVRRGTSPRCHGVTRSVRYLGSNGSCHTFDFRSGVYAAEFARANERKLVNVSPIVASLVRNALSSKQQLPRRIVKRRNPR